MRKDGEESLYEQRVKEIKEHAAQARKNLEDHKQIIELAEELAEGWLAGSESSKEWYTGCYEKIRSVRVNHNGSKHWGGVTLDLLLGKDDHLGGRDLSVLLDEIYWFTRNNGEEVEVTNEEQAAQEDDEESFKLWRFTWKEPFRKLTVKAYVTYSTNCKSVGTGKYKEVMKLVCTA
jgi:hypothetical protein